MIRNLFLQPPLSVLSFDTAAREGADAMPTQTYTYSPTTSTDRRAVRAPAAPQALAPDRCAGPSRDRRIAARTDVHAGYFRQRRRRGGPSLCRLPGDRWPTSSAPSSSRPTRRRRPGLLSWSARRCMDFIATDMAGSPALRSWRPVRSTVHARAGHRHRQDSVPRLARGIDGRLDRRGQRQAGVRRCRSARPRCRATSCRRSRYSPKR